MYPVREKKRGKITAIDVDALLDTVEGTPEVIVIKDATVELHFETDQEASVGAQGIEKQKEKWSTKRGNPANVRRAKAGTTRTARSSLAPRWDA